MIARVRFKWASGQKLQCQFAHTDEPFIITTVTAGYYHLHSYGLLYSHLSAFQSEIDTSIISSKYRVKNWYKKGEVVQELNHYPK